MQNEVVRREFTRQAPTFAVEDSLFADARLAGCDIPKGGVVLLAINNLHRHPDFWDDPETFRPERFTTEAKAARGKEPDPLIKRSVAEVRTATYARPHMPRPREVP